MKKKNNKIIELKGKLSNLEIIVEDEINPTLKGSPHVQDLDKKIKSKEKKHNYGSRRGKICDQAMYKREAGDNTGGRCKYD